MCQGTGIKQKIPVPEKTDAGRASTGRAPAPEAATTETEGGRDAPTQTAAAVKKTEQAFRAIASIKTNAAQAVVNEDRNGNGNIATVVAAIETTSITKNTKTKVRGIIPIV